METQEQRFAAWEVELRDKYTQADRDRMAKSGEAMPDGAYPIADAEDLGNAISTVGLGNASNAAIRRHIIKRADALGLSSKIPDEWNSDGSKESKSALRAAAAGDECPTCGGDGKIMGGNRKCPDCNGTGVVPEGRSQPTEQDPIVATKLAAAKAAVDDATAAQALDPDKDTDPDDAEVSAHIGTAGHALTNALAAQAKDGADDPPQRSRRRQRHRAVPLMPEVRHWRADGLEVREQADSNEIVIVGSPIVYDTPYTVVDLFGSFEERMRPGVAANVLARGADVRFLFNHDGLPLARTTAGTLKLEDTPTALRMTAVLDARQSIAHDLAIAIERGDVSQMSCGFIVRQDTWDERMEHREIVELDDLLDVSSVTYPASPTTSLEVARRMALAIPVESAARARKFYADARAGMKMSAGNQDKVLGALHTLHAALGDAGVATDWDDPNAEPDGDEGLSPDGSEGGSGNLTDQNATLDVTRSARTLRLALETRKRRRVSV